MECEVLLYVFGVQWDESKVKYGIEILFMCIFYILEELCVLFEIDFDVECLMGEFFRMFGEVSYR